MIMTFGTSVTKTFIEWDKRLDELVYPNLFDDIVSELRGEGYEPENVNERRELCQEKYDRITGKGIFSTTQD